jgi:hypothetical protein
MKVLSKTADGLVTRVPLRNRFRMTEKASHWFDQ